MPIASADWRFACGALRTAGVCAGAGEGDIRDGFVADDASCLRPSARGTASRPPSPGASTAAVVCAGRQHHGDRQRGGVDRPDRRGAPAAAMPATWRGRSPTPAACISCPRWPGWGAVLGRTRARAGVRPQPRDDRRPHRARRRRVDRLPGPRRVRGDVRRRRRADPRCSRMAAPAGNDALMQFQADMLGVPVIRSGAADAVGARRRMAGRSGGRACGAT